MLFSRQIKKKGNTKLFKKREKKHNNYQKKKHNNYQYQGVFQLKIFKYFRLSMRESDTWMTNWRLTQELCKFVNIFICRKKYDDQILETDYLTKELLILFK